MLLVHFTDRPENFDNVFIVSEVGREHLAFGGLCVYRLSDVQRDDYLNETGEYWDGIEDHKKGWGDRVALVLRTEDFNVELLQEAPVPNALDEYVIRTGARVEIMEMR